MRRTSRNPATAGLSSASFSWRRQRLAVFGLRFRRLARLRQPEAEVLVVGRQTAAEVGDGGVLVGQFLPKRQRGRYSASASAGLPICRNRWPRLR